MLDSAETELGEIRRLALDPTPNNFQRIEGKLQDLALNLSQALEHPESLLGDAARARRFFEELPAEMARLQSLLSTPLAFYQGLESIRAAHFGSYERSGGMRSLEPKPFSRTVLHL